MGEALKFLATLHGILIGLPDYCYNEMAFPCFSRSADI